MTKKIAMNSALYAPESKGKVFETSLDKYFELTGNDQLVSLVGVIRQIEDKDARRKMKGNLPIRCPHYYWFKDNHRAMEGIVPEAFTFQTCVDIDKMEQVEPALTRAYLLNNEEGGQWQGLLLHVERSASGKLHLDIRIPVGMTIEEAQRAYTEALGVEFDTNCISPERAIYITDAASQLYTSDDWYAQLPEEELEIRRKAYADRGLDIDGRPLKPEPVSHLGNNSQVSQESDLGGSSEKYPSEYQGIPYAMIVEELTQVMGGRPEHGARNTFIYRMACSLRAICNGELKWIQQILPNFGEDQKRVNDTIVNACTYSKSMTMSKELKEAIWQASERLRLDKSDASGLNREPQLPPQLPKPLNFVVSKAPKMYHPAIAVSSFTSFATYTGGVKLDYYDGNIIEATQINGLVSKSSTGKSSIKLPLKWIVKPIKDKDKESRERENEWAETCNSRGANKDKPERPKDICIQCIFSDATAAALVRRSGDAEQAGDKALMILMDEIEMFYELAGGKKPKVTQLIRRDYDTDELGQERVGKESVRADTILRANIMFSSTDVGAKSFFDGQISNGTFSRVSMCTIVRDDQAGLPKFGKYDEKYLAKLQPYIERLEMAHGTTIFCKQARELAEELAMLVNDRSSMMDSEAYRAIGYRSVESAFRKACLLYIMNGNKWNKDIAAFMRWLFEYDMWVKFEYFGEMLAKAFGDDAPQKTHHGPNNLLEQLNDEFTLDDLIHVRNKGNSKEERDKAINLASQWKGRGWIEYTKADDGTKVYKKTAGCLTSMKSVA